MQQSCHNVTECKGQFVCKPVRYFECWQVNYHRLDECLQVNNVRVEMLKRPVQRDRRNQCALPTASPYLNCWLGRENEGTDRATEPMCLKGKADQAGN